MINKTPHNKVCGICVALELGITNAVYTPRGLYFEVRVHDFQYPDLLVEPVGDHPLGICDSSESEPN